MKYKLIAAIILTFILSGILAGCADNAQGSQAGGDNPGNNATLNNNEHQSGGSTEANATQNSDNTSGTASGDEGDSEGESNENTDPTEPTLEIGSAVGNLCPALDLERVGGGTVNIENYRGKVVVVNIWGTWCPPCKEELPDFDRIASEYDDVVIIAAHSNSGRENAEAYVNTNFPSSKIIFAYDTANNDYWSAIGGVRYYPRTVVLDKNGVITYGGDGALSYEALKYLVENAGAEE